MAMRRTAANGDGKAADPWEPVGTVICEGTVLGRAVPWRSPTMTRDGFVGSRNRDRNRSYKQFVAWLHSVRLQAATHYKRRGGLYGGPVSLDVTFYLKRGRGRPADLTNLLKAFEDGLQGSIIVNDTQVRRTVAERVVGADGPERAEYWVIAL